MSIEEPKFVLVTKEGDFEIRDYAPSVVAQVLVAGDQKTAVRDGFRQLAGYIFGGNVAQTSIAMTAPVAQQATSQKIEMTAPVAQTPADAEGRWIVRFTMPSTFMLETLPVPTNPQVKLVAVPAARFAVLRFSGLASVSRVADKTADLLALVQAKRLAAMGPVTIAQYNPPWTLWFLRRNEVMVEIKV